MTAWILSSDLNSVSVFKNNFVLDKHVVVSVINQPDAFISNPDIKSNMIRAINMYKAEYDDRLEQIKKSYTDSVAVKKLDITFVGTKDIIIFTVDPVAHIIYSTQTFNLDTNQFMFEKIDRTRLYNPLKHNLFICRRVVLKHIQSIVDPL